MLANGSMSSAQSGEGEIRKNLVEADLVDCMVALPGQLFYSTQIPACLWFLARDRRDGRFRDRRGQVLFGDIPGSGQRRYFMERRGDGVPVIFRETRALCGRAPSYRLLDDSDLILRIPAATTVASPATVAVTVHHEGGPVAAADVLALFPNKTYKRGVTNDHGEVSVELHATDLPMTVFVAAQGFRAHVERDWVPAEGGLAVDLQHRRRGGAVIFPEATGQIPGLRGRLNPIRDPLDRTCLYASNIAINRGEAQPVHFRFGE